MPDSRRINSEKYLESQLTKKVAELGGKALKFYSQIEIGYPDRLVLMPGGQATWVEMKTKGDKPRRIQQIRHEQLRSLGFEVFVIDTPDKIQEFINHLKTKDR